MQSTGAGAPVGPPGGPIGPVGRGPAEEPKPGPDVRKIVLTVLAIIGAALVGVLVASLFTTGNKTDAAPPPSSQTQPTVTVTSTTSSTPKPSSSTRSTSSSASSSSTTSSTGNDDDFTGGEAFVKQYYGLLPGNPEAAWALLTPKAQAKSKGKKAFFDFYARFSEVKISGTNQNGNVVTGTVKFTPNDGGQADTEPYRFVLVKQGGNFLIDDFDQTSGR
ncbi:hypothetical protein GCM10029964_113990 [Kibdelosporangium lantanae]